MVQETWKSVLIDFSLVAYMENFGLLRLCFVLRGPEGHIEGIAVEDNSTLL